MINDIKSKFTTDMSIGSSFLMLWALMEFMDAPLDMSLFLIGGIHLLLGLLFYILTALKEKEED